MQIKVKNVTEICRCKHLKYRLKNFNLPYVVKQSRITNKALVALDEYVTILREQYNCDVRILKKINNNFSEMFVQTETINNMYFYYSFPESRNIDGTFN